MVMCLQLQRFIISSYGYCLVNCLVVMSGNLKDWQSSKEYLLCTLLPGGGCGGGGGGWGISFIFTSGQHCQMIDCANKYFCCSCNLYYIRDCFFKRFFLVASHY